MNHLIIWVISVGFGALAWGMLVVSDWLLRDDDERLPTRPALRVNRNQVIRFGNDFSLTSRNHRQMGCSHEKG